MEVKIMELLYLASKYFKEEKIKLTTVKKQAILQIGDYEWSGDSFDICLNDAIADIKSYLKEENYGF